MRCDDVRDYLLLPETEADGVENHVAACADCRGFARRMGRLEAVLRSTLVVEPPAELQARLATLARAAARPAESPAPLAPAPRRLPFAIPALSLGWASRPPASVAQFAAGIAVALVGWQVFAWLSTYSAVLGNVPYALELVAASPAVRYLSDVPADVQGFLAWSVVGLVGWMVSESGPLGKHVGRFLELP